MVSKNVKKDGISLNKKVKSSGKDSLVNLAK
jgi:hypothetical protein